MPIPKSHPLIELRDASFAGIRANLIPGIALWIVGISVVLVYHFVESARPGFQWIMELKETYGFLYSGIATSIFGGLIPFLYLLAAGRVPAGKVLSWGLFFLIYWSTRGVEVDAFYRLQAWLFGNELNWQTIVTKVLVDQFLYCPLWSAPLTAICYVWKNVGFSRKRLRERINRRLFLFEIPGVLLSVWIIWIPATSIIYSLPLPLQIPLFNLVMCFYVLLISVLGPEENEKELNDPS